MRYLPETTATMGSYLLATNGNLTDVFLTAGVYFANRMLGLPRKFSAIGAAGAVCAGELAQKFGLLPGTYDPKDLAAAAVGAGLALGADKLISKIRENKEGGLVEALD